MTRAFPPRAVALVFAVVACAGSATEGPELAAPHRPPPKPGSSITHSKMCTCQACNPRSCCAGSSEPEVSSRCTESSYDYDWEGCAMQVQSCEPRCSERVYRVRLNQSCDELRPPECC